MSKPSAKRMRRCHDGKRRFETLEAAKRQAAMFAASKAKKGEPIVTMLRAYGCACGGFHFGRTKAINWDLVK